MDSAGFYERLDMKRLNPDTGVGARKDKQGRTKTNKDEQGRNGSRTRMPTAFPCGWFLAKRRKPDTAVARQAAGGR